MAGGPLLQVVQGPAAIQKYGGAWGSPSPSAPASLAWPIWGPSPLEYPVAPWPPLLYFC